MISLIVIVLVLLGLSYAKDWIKKKWSRRNG